MNLQQPAWRQGANAGFDKMDFFEVLPSCRIRQGGFSILNQSMGGIKMNTQGWIRGYMAKNMEEETFLAHVVECLGREFEAEAGIKKEGDRFLAKFGVYETQLNTADLIRLKLKGPYCLDKHILDQLQQQSFGFDKYRSQYIRYVYGNFYRTEDGCVY